MNDTKNNLLKAHYPTISSSALLCGYHRGRRRLFGPIFLPDIISVHHLHLHVIVEPRPILRIFKYPAWFSPMWVSDQKVMASVGERTRKRGAKVRD